jgi:hypothetical protein
VLLDPRTLRDDETSVVAAAVAAARLRIRGGGPG